MLLELLGSFKKYFFKSILKSIKNVTTLECVRGFVPKGWTTIDVESISHFLFYISSL